MGAGQDEVEVDEEAEPGVEWNPAEDKVEGVLNDVQQGEGHEVHQPWCKRGWVRGMESFVGEEHWEEDGGGDAIKKSARWLLQGIW